MYTGGHGVDKNYVTAVKWYKKAADQGDAAGQNNLGWAYAGGHGVAKDYGAALEWYRKAAEQGFAPGQNHLGMMYCNGCIWLAGSE
jgi:uncharacterized protein